jgi:hypothetical protein
MAIETAQTTREKKKEYKTKQKLRVLNEFYLFVCLLGLFMISTIFSIPHFTTTKNFEFLHFLFFHLFHE